MEEQSMPATEGSLGSHRLNRRTVLLGAAAGAVGATAVTATGGAALAASDVASATHRPYPLWKTAGKRGILYGSSTSTWQLDPGYSKLFDRHAAILFTEDDFLWYRLKPKPDSPVDFTYSDQIVSFAEANRQLVLAAHLVWDDGFGPHWKHKDLWDISEKRARKILYGTMRETMHRYRGRVAIWSVVNEAILNGSDSGYKGLREDVPWFQTIGPEYVEHAFHVAHEADPDACLMMNDFGYETHDQYDDKAIDKQRYTLQVLDRLLGKGVPINAFGIQAHLLADHFHERFHAKRYRWFLNQLSERGLKIIISEMDVLDDGLPKAVHKRDLMVADVYRRFLDVALEEPDIAAVINFGLSDRYTWLDEDYPRADGAHRRPLPFDRGLKPTPSFHAIHNKLAQAPRRWPSFNPPRHIRLDRTPGL